MMIAAVNNCFDGKVAAANNCCSSKVDRGF